MRSFGLGNCAVLIVSTKPHKGCRITLVRLGFDGLAMPPFAFFGHREYNDGILKAHTTVISPSNATTYSELIWPKSRDRITLHISIDDSPPGGANLNALFIGGPPGVGFEFAWRGQAGAVSLYQQRKFTREEYGDFVDGEIWYQQQGSHGSTIDIIEVWCNCGLPDGLKQPQNY